MRVRVRLAGTDGSRGRVLETTQVSGSIQADDEAQLTIQTFEDVPAGSVLSLEMSNGGPWASPRNDLFVMQEVNGDAKDLTKSKSLRGAPWMAELARRAVVHPAITRWGVSKAGERLFPNPGEALRELIDEAQDRGWGPAVQVDFDGTHDADGAPWLTTDGPVRVKVWATIADVLRQVSADGQAQWWTEGTTLKVARVGPGADRTDVVKLRSGASLPVKTDAKEIATVLNVVYDGGSVLVPNPGADDTFGAREVVLTLSGVRTEAHAVQMAEAYLAELRAPLVQLGFRYDGPLDFLPFFDFQVGDTVLCQTGTGWEPRTVQGVTFSDTSVEIKVGDRIVSADAALRKKVGKLTLGSLSGGSIPLPSTTPGTSTIPAEPVNVRVSSNTGRWLDGAPVGTVTVEWDEVTAANDGSSLEVVGYQVWARTADRPEFLVATSDTEAASIEWVSGEERFMKVRAQSSSGEWGAFSEEVATIANAPDQVEDVPSVPVLESPSTVVLVWWDGQLALGPVPDGFQHLVVEHRIDGADWVVSGAPTETAGRLVQVATIKAPEGAAVDVRFTWVDRAGRVSDPSSVAPIIVSGVAADIGPGTISADLVVPEFGENLNLAANGTIQLLTGRADSTDATLNQFTQAVLFEADGTVWSSPGSSASVKVANDGLQFRDEGVVVAEITQTEMRIAKLRALQTFVGETVISERPGGASWVHI